MKVLLYLAKQTKKQTNNQTNATSNKNNCNKPGGAGRFKECLTLLRPSSPRTSSQLITPGKLEDEIKQLEGVIKHLEGEINTLDGEITHLEGKMKHLECAINP